MFTFRAALFQNLCRSQMPWQLVLRECVNKHVTHICSVSCLRRQSPQQHMMSRRKDPDLCNDVFLISQGLTGTFPAYPTYLPRLTQARTGPLLHLHLSRSRRELQADHQTHQACPWVLVLMFVQQELHPLSNHTHTHTPGFLSILLATLALL